MKPLYFIITFVIFSIQACCQAENTSGSFTPHISTIHHRLAEKNIRIRIYQYGPVSNYVFLNLHDDEITSVKGAKSLLEKHGGTLIKIENGKNRNIQFIYEGKKYSIDPNRIFSEEGIKKTLGGRDSSYNLVNEVKQFSSRILSLLPVETKFVIALHNNTNGRLAVNEYLPGNTREKDAKDVFVAANEDPDDFFLTTDSLFFRHLAASNFNSVLQNDITVEQDGSLSVYFGGKNISYLNCETEHGRLEQYKKMIEAALVFIRQKSEE